MRTFKALVVLLMGWVASWSEGSAGQYHWDNNAGTMPHEMNPPWTLISEGNVYAYLAPDAGPTTGHLLSTQVVDNVYFEQRGSSLQMTQPLVIQAVLRLVSGTSTSDKSGPVGFAFTVFVDNTAVLQGELHESQGNFGSGPRIPGTNSVHDGDATILVRGSCGPCLFVYPDSRKVTTAQRAWWVRYFRAFETGQHGSEFTDTQTGDAAILDVDSFIDAYWLIQRSRNVDGIRCSVSIGKACRDTSLHLFHRGSAVIPSMSGCPEAGTG